MPKMKRMIAADTTVLIMAASSHFFHGVEKLFGVFPRSGKTLADFYVPWKNIFHGT